MDIYGDLNSGNCLKVKYVCDYLNLAYRWHAVDVAAGGARDPALLRLNPAGQVPVVVLADGRALAQSNAVMAYLAEATPLLPADPFLRAKVLEQLFWEQYSHEPYIAVCRYQLVYLGRPREALETWRVERGEHALNQLDAHLQGRAWLVGDGLTIADIGLLAYTRLAPQGGFSLATRPAVQAWIERCEQKLGLART